MPRIADALEHESRTVDLEQGDFERLLGRRERKQRNRRIRAGALGVIVALAIGTALVRSLTSDPIPAHPRPTPAPAPHGIFSSVGGWIAFDYQGCRRSRRTVPGRRSCSTHGSTCRSKTGRRTGLGFSR